MVTLGSLLSNRPELQEVAKVFSRVLKQMDVYLNLECKYTVGGEENIHTNHLLMRRVAWLLTFEAWKTRLLSGRGRPTLSDPMKHILSPTPTPQNTSPHDSTPLKTFTTTWFPNFFF